MSIYPVYLASWFPRRSKKHAGLTLGDLAEAKHQYEAASVTVQYSTCMQCGGKCTWKRAWGHHAIPYGYGDVWCTKKCYDLWRTKK